MIKHSFPLWWSCVNLNMNWHNSSLISGSGSGPESGLDLNTNWLVLVTYPTQPPSFVIIRPQLFLISHYICRFWPQLSTGEESLQKLRNSHIWIFTGIESIRPCQTPNLSIKCCANPSITLWDIVLHIIFGSITQWWRITEKNSIRSSPKSNEIVLVTHPTCPPNFVQICP